MHLREADFHSPSLFTLQGVLDFKPFFLAPPNIGYLMAMSRIKICGIWGTQLTALGTPTAGPALGSRIVSHVLWSLGAAESPRLATWCWEVTFKNIMRYMGCKICSFRAINVEPKSYASKCASGWPFVVFFLSRFNEKHGMPVSQQDGESMDLRRGTVMLVRALQFTQFRSKWPTYAPKITRNIHCQSL